MRKSTYPRTSDVQLKIVPWERGMKEPYRLFHPALRWQVSRSTALQDLVLQEDFETRIFLPSTLSSRHRPRSWGAAAVMERAL